MDQLLKDRRAELERSWRCGVAEHRPAKTVRPEVLASWRRSSITVAPGLSSAPVEAPDDIAGRWATSRLGRASRVILDDLKDIAAGGDMMSAITDETVTIAWIAGGRTMSRRAERVHFDIGGRWAESAAGTNALAVAAETTRPSSIFSAEHYAEMVHDWVCYSAPIMDPFSGRFLGVIDVSTVWHRAHPTLLTTVSALARCVEYELHSVGDSDEGEGTGGLHLQTMGTPSVRVDGDLVAMTRRQLEILTVLSLHPGGLSLDELAGRVYGDQPVSMSTVKAELSHLRQRLGGRIGSRPYRLVGPVVADHQRILSALAGGSVSDAVEAYHGPMLPASDSPEIEMWRERVDVAVRDAVLNSRRADLLWTLSGRCPDDLEVHEATLAALPANDARRSIMVGRSSAATRSLDR